jgi:DedD protein
LLSGRSETLNTESRRIELPAKPEELSFETRRFPVGIPEKAVPPAPTHFDAPDADAQDAGGNDAGNTPPQQPDLQAKDPERVAAVTTVILSPPENTPAVEPEAAAGLPRYLVQVASFSSEKRANAMAAELRASKLPVVMDVVERTAGRLHRVRVGPYVDRSEADTVVSQIRSMNKALSPRILDTRPGDGAPPSAPSDPLVRWVVQVGSYSSSGTAESEVAKLRLAGLTAFSEKVISANSITYKVRIGPEIDRARAVQLAKDIKAKHNIDGFVTTQE